MPQQNRPCPRCPYHRDHRLLRGLGLRLSTRGCRPWIVHVHHGTLVAGDSALYAGWRGQNSRPRIRPGPEPTRHPVPCPIESPRPWPIGRRELLPGPGHCAQTFLPQLPPHPIEASRASVQRQRWRHLLQARPRAPAQWPVSRPAARSLLLTSNSLSILLTMHAPARTWRGQTFAGFPGTSGVPIGRLRARSIVEFCMPGSKPGSDVTRCHRHRPWVSRRSGP